MAGPYSPKDALPLDYLAGLQKRISDERADYVFLMGPYLDEENKKVQEGEFKSAYEENYIELEQYFTLLLQVLGKSGGCVYLVPSPKEIMCLEPLPQTASFHESSRRVTSNPFSISIGANIKIKVLNADYVRETIPSCRFNGNQNKIDSVLTQILYQRTLVPAIPTGMRVDFNESLCFNLDGDDDFQVLIAPSIMNEFAKVIQGKLFINPGLASKGGQGDGSYLKLEFGSSARAMNKVMVKASILKMRLAKDNYCLLYTSPSPRDRQKSRMPSSA
eukprot:TRINITY_DN13934_c0_g1_i2.p1 TRINITY_DN13934_c0_g1~~TRINITY_DN13934_c0_g1_i2.p1  ORF type:complete len:275 (-),score=72.49 TRINITY_DN13934_c0_g1_i2:26-850(-)